MIDDWCHAIFGTSHLARYLAVGVVYTLFIILITVSVTYAHLLSRIGQKLPINQSLAQQTLPGEDNYVEKGSPYDNRTIADESSNVIFHGPRNKKQIALTFDAEMTDGMKAAYLSGKVTSSYDKRIVDTLIATQTKATFFLTGMWIELYPNVTKQLSQNALFELGSHSYTDSSYTGFCYGLHQLANTLKIEDIGATEKLLRQYAGINNQLFRFPGGCYTPADVKLVNNAGDTVIHWDVAEADGFNNNTNQIVRNVVDNVQNGSIVVFHINGAPTSPKTGEALPQIILELKAKGFEFVKISELLGLPSETRVKF